MKRQSGGSRTEAGRNEAGAGPERDRQEEPPEETDSDGRTPDHVDAINQLFAEFELAYHNQYHKAYGDPDRLAITKKYWLERLSDFTPQQIVAAGRQLVRTHPYLPTLSAVYQACEKGHELFGLPSERDAYVEACRAPEPKSAQSWSHPAVYHAGRNADWYLLATAPEDKAFPVFVHYYRQLCRRVMHGEDLEAPQPPALEREPERPLSHAERRERMQALRQRLKV